MNKIKWDHDDEHHSGQHKRWTMKTDAGDEEDSTVWSQNMDVASKTRDLLDSQASGLSILTTSDNHLLFFYVGNTQRSHPHHPRQISLQSFDSPAQGDKPIWATGTSWGDDALPCSQPGTGLTGHIQ